MIRPRPKPCGCPALGHRQAGPGVVPLRPGSGRRAWCRACLCQAQASGLRAPRGTRRRTSPLGVQDHFVAAPRGAPTACVSSWPPSRPDWLHGALAACPPCLHALNDHPCCCGQDCGSLITVLTPAPHRFCLPLPLMGLIALHTLVMRSCTLRGKLRRRAGCGGSRAKAAPAKWSNRTGTRARKDVGRPAAQQPVAE